MTQYRSTEEFAAQNLVQPQSVRARYCRTGSYFGARPHKLPNGRLLWPAHEPEATEITSPATEWTAT